MHSFFVSRSYPLKKRFNEAQSLKRLQASPNGLACDIPEVPIEIATGYGYTTTLRFVCDTGSDHMVIPIYVARHKGIRYREEYPGSLSTMGGAVRCYYDFVQVRSSLSGRTHHWVCAFADSAQARLIAGRSGLLDDFAVKVTGRRLIVSRPVSLSRFLKHHAARVRAHADDAWQPI